MRREQGGCSLVRVSVELARRLLETGVVPADEIFAALSDSVSTGVPFVQALVTRGPETADLVDRELGRARGPVLSSVRIAIDLATQLPVGMCERLLAVPVGRAPSGAVEVAVVDSYDPAVGVELSHQLGAPVSIVRAPLGEILLALDRYLDERDRAAVRSTRTPAFGTRVPRTDAAPTLRQAFRAVQEEGPDPNAPPGEHQSWPPIPLVRRSMPPLRTRVDTNPGVGADAAAAPASIHGMDETGTSILGLTRSKAPPPAAPPSVREPNLQRLDSAESADELVQLLTDAAAGLSALVLVIALRGKLYEARGGFPPTSPERTPLRLAPSPGGVLERALHDGHYLGYVPADPAHAELATWADRGEIYLAPIRVGGRAPLCLLLAGLRSSLETTRHADAIARRAEQVLERIVLDRKRKG